MLNQTLSILVNKLRALREDRASLAECAEWSDLSEFEVKRLFSKTKLKTKSFKKREIRVRGYLRMDLIELQERLEREAKGQSEAPIQDYFCQQCSEVFEARSALCPQVAEHTVHRVLNKAPGTIGPKTKIMDRALSTALRSQGLTNVPKPKLNYDHPMWQKPGAAANIGSQMRQMYPHLPQVQNFPDTPMPTPGKSGLSQVVPSTDPKGTFTTSDGRTVPLKRTPTQIFAADPTPLPSVQ